MAVTSLCLNYEPPTTGYLYDVSFNLPFTYPPSLGGVVVDGVLWPFNSSGTISSVAEVGPLPEGVAAIAGDGSVRIVSQQPISLMDSYYLAGRFPGTYQAERGDWVTVEDDISFPMVDIVDLTEFQLWLRRVTNTAVNVLADSAGWVVVAAPSDGPLIEFYIGGRQMVCLTEGVTLPVTFQAGDGLIVDGEPIDLQEVGVVRTVERLQQVVRDADPRGNRWETYTNDDGSVRVCGCVSEGDYSLKLSVRYEQVVVADGVVFPYVFNEVSYGWGLDDDLVLFSTSDKVSGGIFRSPDQMKAVLTDLDPGGYVWDYTVNADSSYTFFGLVPADEVYRYETFGDGPIVCVSIPRQADLGLSDPMFPYTHSEGFGWLVDGAFIPYNEDGKSGVIWSRGELEQWIEANDPGGNTGWQVQTVNGTLMVCVSADVRQRGRYEGTTSDPYGLTQGSKVCFGPFSFPYTVPAGTHLIVNGERYNLGCPVEFDDNGAPKPIIWGDSEAVIAALNEVAANVNWVATDRPDCSASICGYVNASVKIEGSL